MASNASKSSDWQKVSGFSGVVTLGKEPTFDEVYGAGFVPMIVAHDKAVQKIPSPTRIAFESVLFGPSGGSNGEPAKPIQTPPLDAPVPSMFSRPFVFDEKAAECEYNAKLSDAFATSVEESKALFSEISDAWRIPKTRNKSTKKAIEEMAGKIIGSGGNDGSAIVPEGIENATIPPTPPDAALTIVDEEHARLLAEAKMTIAIESVTDFASLVPVAHEMAVSKGWWQDGIDSRSIDEIVANYHAEVSEAWEEYRAGRMATWYAEGSRKPDGFWIEIADLLIRIADAEGANSDISNGDRPHQLRLEHSPRSERVHYINGRKSKFAAFICELNVEVCAECVEHSPVTLCEEFAKSNNVDLYAAVREKLRYNATRPYRHGGKLA